MTLIGTPPNLLCSMALEEAGFRGFRMFDFLPTGLAVMITGASIWPSSGGISSPLANRAKA